LKWEPWLASCPYVGIIREVLTKLIVRLLRFRAFVLLLAHIFGKTIPLLLFWAAEEIPAAHTVIRNRNASLKSEHTAGCFVKCWVTGCSEYENLHIKWFGVVTEFLTDLWRNLLVFYDHSQGCERLCWFCWIETRACRFNLVQRVVWSSNFDVSTSR